MSILKLKQPFIVLMCLLLLAVAGCNFGTDKSKELELKEKELALKEKELELKGKKSDKDDSEEEEEETEKPKKRKKSEKTESVKKGVYTPKANSAERKQIMNGLRSPVQREFKQDVIFKVEYLKVSGDWAFMVSYPVAKSGGKLDLSGTKYNGSEPITHALLKKKGGRWTVVDYIINCEADVCYRLNGWESAPREIFPIGNTPN